MEQKITSTTSFKVQATIDFIEARLHKPVTSTVFRTLIKKLEIAQQECIDDRLNKALIFLYGKLVESYNLHIRNILEEIIVASQSPQKAVPSKLQHKVHKLKKEEGLSRENWDLLLQLETLLTDSSPPFTFNKQRDIFLPEIEDLFELISFIYYEKSEQIISTALQDLSCTAKQRLLKYLPSLHCSSKKLARMQSLFATIYELSGSSQIRLPSEKEIDLFFAEREEILQKEENKQTSIFFLERQA